MGEIIQQEDSRRVFIDTLISLAEQDPAIVFIIPDVGFNYAELFFKKFPTRSFNFGTTEQSTMIIAAALALSGLKPYVYSMINFVAFRPFEMVRNAISLHAANVKIIGVKGSEKYKFLGFSHNMIFENEDKYILEKYIPCHFPENNEEVRSTVLETYNNPSAAYIRL